MTQIHDNMKSAKAENDPQAKQDLAVKNSLNKIKNKIIVMSGKGGVGKTSVSVNLSIALAKKGFKVGIVDVDLHGPDVPRMLGITGLLDVNEKQKLKPKECNVKNLRVISIESLLQNRDEAIIWRGPLKFSAIKQFIGDVSWDELDFMIIDAPPGTGDEPLTIAQTIPDAKAIIVTTPQQIALADVRKSINFCNTVKMKILGLVENMSGFKCPHCGQVMDIFQSGGGKETADNAKLNFLGKIPFDTNVVTDSDQGKSVLNTNPELPVSNAFVEVADRVAELTS